MKERLKKRSVLRLSLQRLIPNRQGLSQAGRFAAFALGSGLLSVLPIGGGPVPLAACVAAASTGVDLAASVLGCLVGYGLRWELADGVWPMVLTVVLPVIAWLLRKSSHREIFWFCPAAYTVAAAAVGLGILWQLAFPPYQLGHYFLGLLTVFFGSLICIQALSNRRRGAIYLLGAALLAALSLFSLGRWFNVGICVALFLVAVTSSTAEGIAVAAACGIVLELAADMSLPYTAFFCLCSAICYGLRRLTVFHRSLALLVLSALFAWLVADVASQLFLLSAAAACLASLAVPRLSLFSLESSEDALTRFRQQLQRSSDVLLRLHDTILLPQPVQQDPDAAAIFDYAADQVCQNCVNWGVCWEQEAADTYHSLCSAADPILARCKATREDFPASFVNRCQNMDRFIQVVNGQLDAILYRRQYRARLRENREMLRNQYLLLARYLQAAADTGVMPKPQPGRFDPEIAARAVGKSGRALSGDRGACFHGPGESFYVLLCDGMGTGRAAAAESSTAIETLSGLLRSGLDPASSLQLLNSAYVLRDDGCFSTVDLLQVNLSSGDSLLLKWGAAPSYLKRGDCVRRLGEATMPPGLAVNGMRSIQRIRLTLQLNDLLVLTSDGASALVTERCIQTHAGDSVQDLAAGIVAAAAPGDDITAVALRLKENAA